MKAGNLRISDEVDLGGGIESWWRRREMLGGGDSMFISGAMYYYYSNELQTPDKFEFVFVSKDRIEWFISSGIMEVKDGFYELTVGKEIFYSK